MVDFKKLLDRDKAWKAAGWIPTPGSTNVRLIRYDQKTEKLAVQFKSGQAVYVYSLVKPEDFETLRKLESVGKGISALRKIWLAGEEAARPVEKLTCCPNELDPTKHPSAPGVPIQPCGSPNCLFCGAQLGDVP